MSNVETDPRETRCGGVPATGPRRSVLEPRDVPLGGARALHVRRTLPHRDVRTVGAWCFLDDYGPQDLRDGPGMDVPPHPHTGLSTVTWLLEGEVLHRDSLASEQLVRPGELTLMTAGRGIAHSEESTAATRVLRGVQLWVALPDAARHQEPHLEHHADLPVLTRDGARVTVLLGELGGARSPAATYSPIVGADVVLAPGADLRLPLQPSFEHAVLVLEGEPDVDRGRAPRGALVHLGTGRGELRLGGAAPARVLLLGGEPFAEELVMWWNFVGRDHDEVLAARADWEAGAPRFGTVPGYPGAALRAPALPPVRLRPRGNRPA